MSRLQFVKPIARKGGLLSGYTGDPSGIWSLRQRYELLTFPLLDYFPGAAAAYSLRSLSSSYTGPVVTVRRSSDDAEADFTASEVAGGALATWVGANDGFVTTWYDQSGNENNATQATSGAQPKIVSSGSLVEENGRPAIQFDGSNDYLNTPYAAGSTSQQTLICVFSPDSNAPIAFAGIVTGRDNNDDGPGLAQVTTGLRFHVDTADRVIAYSASQSVAVCCYGSSVSSISLDGVSSSGAAPASISTTTNYRIGAGAYRTPVEDFFSGAMQEAIIFPSDLTAQRESVERNIDLSYG